MGPYPYNMPLTALRCSFAGEGGGKKKRPSPNEEEDSPDKPANDVRKEIPDQVGDDGRVGAKRRRGSGGLAHRLLVSTGRR